MSGYAAGDIIRWAFCRDDGSFNYYGEYLMLLSSDYSNNYFNVLDLESGCISSDDWLVDCKGGYWERVA